MELSISYDYPEGLNLVGAVFFIVKRMISNHEFLSEDYIHVPCLNRIRLVLLLHVAVPWS